MTEQNYRGKWIECTGSFKETVTMKQCVCIRLGSPLKRHQQPMLLTFTKQINTELLPSTYAPRYLSILIILTVSSTGYNRSKMISCLPPPPPFSILKLILPISHFIVHLCSLLFLLYPVLSILYAHFYSHVTFYFKEPISDVSCGAMEKL